LLDLPDSDLGIPDIRSPIVRAVVELSKTSGLYPRSLVLQNVLVQERVPVASGRFGSILRGEIEGRTIAIKTMQLETSLKAFCKEAVLWRQLSNRHVLPLFGVYHLPERPLQVCLVSPWMTNGNVVEYLEKNPLADRRTLVIDIARGLEYLHSFDPPILHGDLKGANILVDVSHRACVADFGLGTLVQDSIVQFTPTLSAYQAGTPMSMAPELFSEGEGELMPKALSSDIYSFGCVCYEIFIGKPRFPQCKSIGQMILAVINDQRPSRPSIQKIDDATWALMNRCWDFNPPSRPSANDILRILAPQSKPSGPQSPRVRRRGTIMTNPQSPEAYDLSDATNFAERVTEGLSSSQLDRMSFLPNGVPKETASEPPTHMQRASSDNQSIWVDNSSKLTDIFLALRIHVI
ncbi:kinase-like domain-containing protein, partial [Hygrophoropsis aurantiaca]